MDPDENPFEDKGFSDQVDFVQQLETQRKFYDQLREAYLQGDHGKTVTMSVSNLHDSAEKSQESVNSPGKKFEGNLFDKPPNFEEWSKKK